MKKILAFIASISVACAMFVIPVSAATTVTTADELTAAVNGTDTEIVLGADITASITIPENRTVTIDLGEYTLTNTANQHTITNY